jgi:hypothetical protein
MIALAIVGLFIAAALVWNFVPAVRDKVKGWTTVIEGVSMTALYYFGIVSDAVQEAQKAGYIPSQWLGYVPYLLMAWVLLKRFQTKTPVGGAKK